MGYLWWDIFVGISGGISLVGYLCWDAWWDISGGIDVVGYLGIEVINVASTTESDLSALRLSVCVCGIPGNLSD